MEYYLVQLENKDRINLARFRCRSNQLPINNNRFEEGTYSDLFCHLCSENAIGDEYHYLFSCVFFKEERKRLIGAPYMVNPNTLKMKEVLVCDNLRDLKKLVHFISIVMSVFKETHVYKTTKEVDLLLRNTTTTRSGRIVSRPMLLDL